MRRITVLTMAGLAGAALLWGVQRARAYTAPPQLVPGINYSTNNYANSPILTKFKDTLPGLTPAGVNDLGQYIPVAQPMGAATPAGVPLDGDYYEIAVVDYLEQMHADMPATKLRGYVQIEPPGAAAPAGSLHVPLFYSDGVTPITFAPANGAAPVPVYAYDKPHYMGPLILSTNKVPTRIKFYNLLATTGNGGSLFLPTDTTVMGAGDGPITNTAAANSMQQYSQNRAVVHLHGGDTPWISDGTPHQWITPAGEATAYPNGVSQKNVPDMPVPPSGACTLYFPNGQCGRMMFFHDHSFGMTRLNVYAGEAAGYLLQDPAGTGERTLNTFAPGGEIPLIVQDKTFVNDGTAPATFPLGAPAPAPTAWADPTWTLNPLWGQTKGSLWFPHVYMPNQNPNDLSGANPFGRWDYGPWFWPIFPVMGTLPQAGTASLPSVVPESFMDTPIVNGTAYPSLTLQPSTYRFRVLSVGNERYFNLQMYVAEPLSISVLTGGTGYTNPVVTITDAGGTGAGASATAMAVGGSVVSIVVTNYGTVAYAKPVVTITDALNAAAAGATASASVNTEVRMVPAVKGLGVAVGAIDSITYGTNVPWPTAWTMNDTPGMTPNVLDNRAGGVPDPSSSLQGPTFVHIGSEGGVSPTAVPMVNTPIGFEQNKRTVTVLNTYEHTLFLGPAERADVMVDFSAYAGKTIIVYNDGPAPLPGADPRNDYYTGDPDNTFQGGAPTTIAGFGPNTRTVMQIKVANAAPAPALNVAALSAAVSSIFATTQAKPVVPETTYTAAEGAPPSGTDKYALISDTALTFSPYVGAPEYTGTPVTLPALSKCIQELFDPLGRMNATLGVELPFTTATIQTTIPYGFADPATEVLPDGTTQLWKITHNGVDTHAIHFHLWNVQVINRVGWDGMIKPPWPEELGWKETVKMNPLEDIVVALRAKVPTVPFTLPNNIRPLAPQSPLGSKMDFTGVNPNGNPVAVSNILANFGSEYVWHCHLLGHEENDMMRAVLVATAPVPPSGLTFVVAKGKAVLTWVDNSPDETAYMVQKKTGTSTWTTIATVPAGTLTYTDGTYKPNQGTQYQVIAVNTVGSGVPGYPSVTAYSLPSNTAAAPLGATTIISITQGLALASPVVVNWTYSATDQTGFTIQRSTSNTFPASGTTAFTVAGNVFSFSDTSAVVGLRRNTTFYYRVTPTNGNGAGAPSNIGSIIAHP